MIEKIDAPIIITDALGIAIDPIGGFDTEYGFSARYHKRPIAAESLLGVPAVGRFYADGSRRYVDHTHPEFATAEDIDYLHAAWRVLIGHIIMANMLSEGAEQYPGIDLKLFANVTDGKDDAWGAHQSVLAPRTLSPEDYIPALAVHNLSRIVWSGAGLVVRNLKSPRGFDYHLSERADSMRSVSSLDTTSNRGLVNTRDEPLANWSRYRRIHDISGESIFSSRMMALKLASAVMVLKACGFGARYEDILPYDPVVAMRLISRDPTLQTKVATPSGNFTGIELQEKTLETTVGAIAARHMTEQDRKFKAIWESTLAMLKEDPLSVDSQKQHDWAKKLSIIEKAMSKANAKRSEADIAEIIWLAYSQLLPKFGFGMNAVMNGEFVDSPPREMLEEVQNGGPGLVPPETRAKLRGNVLARLRRDHIELDEGKEHWDEVKIKDKFGLGSLLPRFPMMDPFATENRDIEAALQDLGIRPL